VVEIKKEVVVLLATKTEGKGEENQKIAVE